MVNKALFISEQFYSANPQHGPNVIDTTYRDTLRQSGIVGEMVQIYFGQQASFVVDEQILEYCASYSPEVILFFPTGWLGTDPSRSVFHIVRDKFHIPVLIFRGDANSEYGHRFTASWFPYIDYIVFLDASLCHLGYGGNSKAIQAIQSFNPTVFFDRKLPKDIDVSFVGHLERNPERAEYINFLRSNGINVVTAGGHEKGNISWEEYGTLMSRSKISLNFTHEGKTLNGRVFEVLASRSMMIHDANTEIGQYFSEGEGIIVAKGKEDLLQKIRFFLSHDLERQQITDAGYGKVTKLYNTKNLWAYIFNKAGFKASGDSSYGEYYTKMESLR